MNYCKLILGILFFGLSFQLFAFDSLREFEEVITESYEFTTSEPFIGLNNKYGNIEITTHNESRANLTVKIVVEAANDKRAQEIFDKIDVEIDASASRLNMETVFNSKKWNWTKKNEKYSIHYYIEVPVGSDMDIINKYGDISSTDIQNDVKVELKYGNGLLGNIGGDFSAVLGYSDRFKVGAIDGDAELSMSYSEVEILSAADVDIDSKYTEFHIGSAQEVEASTKYDDLFIGEIASFTNTGKYDDIEIDAVQTIDLETKYSNVIIDELGNEGLFKTSYGQVKIRETASNLRLIKVNAQYTGYNIDIDVPYQLEIDTKYTDVDYPDGLDIRVRDRDSNELYLEGTYKNGGNAKIIAKMKYGHMRL